MENGEDVDPEKVDFLPLGYDEFFGRDTKKEKGNIWLRFILGIENACKPWFDKIDKWVEEQKKKREMEMEELEKELELVEAEVRLKEAMEELEDVLRRQEKEEEKKAEMGLLDEDEVEDEEATSVTKLDEDDTTSVTKQDETAPAVEEEEEEERDEDEEDDIAQSSFGSVEQGQTTNQQKGKPGKSPFSTSSLMFASCSLISVVRYDFLLSFDILMHVFSM